MSKAIETLLMEGSKERATDLYVIARLCGESTRVIFMFHFACIICLAAGFVKYRLWMRYQLTEKGAGLKAKRIEAQIWWI